VKRFSILLALLGLPAILHAAAPACDPAVFEDLRTKIADCQKAHHSLRTDLQILAERLEVRKTAGQEATLGDESIKALLHQLETKIVALEQKQQLMATDLRQLNARLETEVQKSAEVLKEVATIDERVAQHTSHFKKTLEGVVKLHHLKEGASSYTVQNGDTLGEIAKRYGLPIKALKEANQLESDRIFVGQTLSIPSK
jgi:LysM repeat protein